MQEARPPHLLALCDERPAGHAGDAARGQVRAERSGRRAGRRILADADARVEHPGGDAVVGSSTASDNDDGTLIASIGAVALVKSVVIDDQFGGHEAIPGATATYSILATVAGTGSVSSLVVSDPIPAGTTYKAGSLKLNSAALTDQTGDDAGQASSSGISVTLGTLASGATRTITFAVTVD